MEIQHLSFTKRRLLFSIAVAMAVVLAGMGVGAKPGDAQPSEAPGAPGAEAVFTQADKDGFGTATTESSKVWYTLDDGRLTEVYYPDLSTPSVRELQLVVSDGETFADLESMATNQEVQLVDAQALVYRQINTDKDGNYQITKTYVTDPDRSTQLIGVTFESLTGVPYQLYALYDPSLNNGGDDDSGEVRENALVATDSEDGKVASALVATPNLAEKSTGYLGTSGGWQDLKDDYQMDWQYGSSPDGNVLQTARLPIDGVNTQNATLSLGFAPTADGALENAQSSLVSGFQQAQAAYAAGWYDYLASLNPAPQSVSGSELLSTTYNVSAMMLRAHEDKTYHGASIASPSMPWAWATGDIEEPSGAYHLVWPRDLYHNATAMLAVGDRTGAERALDFMFELQQKPDGSFPQNSAVDGTERWAEVQLDQASYPLVLAWQLGRTDETTYQEHVKPAAEFILSNGPDTPQERWENAEGYSPATIAAEIAGLVSAAAIAEVNGDQASADNYLETADEWQSKVEEWTVTTNGPLADHPYYLRITKDGNPDSGITYEMSDGGPCAVDQRAVVDPSYLELVRFGVKPPDDPVIMQSLDVIDEQLGVETPNGTFWHRYNFDGYGEERDGDPWHLSEECGVRDTDSGTIGRLWPIFAGERGEYELAAGVPGAESRLAAIAATGNAGYMLPEQVWDEHPPSDEPGFPAGEGTMSATPLGWTHAQFLRLAWSIDAGYPVEQPALVAARYGTGPSMPSTGGPALFLLPAAALLLATGLIGLRVVFRRA